jgi:putative sterol carrier protein
MRGRRVCYRERMQTLPAGAPAPHPLALATGGEGAWAHHFTCEEQRMAEPSFASIPDAFSTMQSAFLPERAIGVDKTIQFEFSGREAGTWTATVRNGTFAYHQGPAENPNATVSVDSDTWLAILRSELTALDAVMSARLRIQGDMGLMIQFQNWFERPRGI